MADGCIIRMTDKEYLEKFINEIDPSDYTRVIISQKIRIERKFPDTIAMPKLYPPAYSVSEHINGNGCCDEYVESYMTYLNRDENLTLITILVSSVVKKDGKLIFICNRDESDYNHLEILCDLIEDIFELKCYSLKKFLKLGKPSIPNKNKVVEQLERMLEYLKKVDMDKKEQLELECEKVKRDLKKRSWDYLYNFCKKRNIKVKKKYDKSQIIDNMIKAIRKDPAALDNPSISDGFDDDEDDY